MYYKTVLQNISKEIINIKTKSLITKILICIAKIAKILYIYREIMLIVGCVYISQIIVCGI